MTSTVVVLSGGMDSTALLYRARHQFQKVIAVSFNYGQKHVKELEAAINTCSTLEIEHYVVPLAITDFVESSSLTSSDEVPEGHYTAENMKSTVVPNRNAIMLAIAYGLGVDRKVDEVQTAVHAGDHAVYPDCRPEFIESLSRAFYVGNDMGEGAPYLTAPFVRSTKSDIVLTGESYAVDWSSTWTCYNGREKSCGRCGTCVERLEAFHIAGVHDPLEYEDTEFWRLAVQAHRSGGESGEV